MSADALIPDGCTVRRLSLAHLGDSFDWWRVEQGGRVVGSGFDRVEAIENAWVELARRYDGEFP